MADVVLRDVVKNYGALPVVHAINLDIAHGEFVVLVGPSGCGKSTTLRMIAGLEDISGGTIKIGDRVVNDLPPRDRNISMVFQNYALYPHMTVRENLGFSLHIARRPKAEIDKAVAEAAEILSLRPLLDRKPGQLSGGQRQRVAMGRAIVRHPDVFLFDEPLSNLDAKLRTQMRVEIKRLHQKVGTTIIYVTHDQIEAMTLADRIVVLRDGRIEQQGSPIDLYDEPDNIFVAGFIGSPRMNFLPGEIVSAGLQTTIKLAEFGQPTLTVRSRSGGGKPGDKVTVGVRPEHFIDATAAPIAVSGKAVVIEQLGGVSYVYAASESGAQITVQQKGHSRMATDAKVSFGVDPATCLAFDANGKRL